MLSEKRWEELLNYTYETACRLYGDDPDVDMLVQETLLALIKKEQAGEHIEHPKGFLATVLRNKRNDQLRRQYRDSIVTYDLPRDLAAEEPEEDLSDEHESVRREISRLLKIYREVTVRHYMHGQPVEQIARELGIPKGTVLSRLSAARRQIKGGLTAMKAYSEYSYEPKTLQLGIHGGTGLRGEPFILMSSPIEQNVLILAYERPISMQVLADTMGMPCAYLEPIVDKLVNGELMGRTSGGLVYTRCFLQHRRDRFGNIAVQEAFAQTHAHDVWTTVWVHTESLMTHHEVQTMSDKQKATLLLFVLQLSLNKLLMDIEPDMTYPERPNGGRWLAIGTYGESNDVTQSMYDTSGPCTHQQWDSPRYRVFDFQSCFGDTHWRYNSFRYRVDPNQIARFLASFFIKGLEVHQTLYELIPDFENLHILTRDKANKAAPDFPALTWTVYEQCLEPAVRAIAQDLMKLFGSELETIRISTKHRIPAHVDQADSFVHYAAFGAYVVAQMLAIVKQGLLPYPVEVGKTPILFVAYEDKE
ncbi:MAG: RNA polymerase sigma factor [Clostridia bacterium]|nr:RNA polymerase sigma factor [Clostridia bacterium]